ncbi:MAG: 50S ribosomal protein L6 [Candidatus Pacearchaeota archaeon]|jgi:large subunit ribosomal protein L6
MRKELYKEVEVPSGVEVEIDGGLFNVKGKEGENSRMFKTKGLEFVKKDGKISIGSKNSTKKEKKMMNTIAAHISNMIKGVQEKFEYELKSVFSHFPITIEAKGREVLIKNFLGEKTPRKATLPEKVEIEINGNVIKVRSIDKELAGQAAAKLETATKIRSRDRRVFQDGIFMTKKVGSEI